MAVRAWRPSRPSETSSILKWQLPNNLLQEGLSVCLFHTQPIHPTPSLLHLSLNKDQRFAQEDPLNARRFQRSSLGTLSLSWYWILIFCYVGCNQMLIENKMLLFIRNLTSHPPTHIGSFPEGEGVQIHLLSLIFFPFYQIHPLEKPFQFLSNFLWMAWKDFRLPNPCQCIIICHYAKKML